MKEEGERKAAQRKREERREVGERKVERGGIEEER